jgi:hypothetical protein
VRKELLKEKAAEIQRECSKWAEEHKILAPGERLVVMIRVAGTPPVVRGPSDTDVSPQTLARNFFTKDRLTVEANRLGLTNHAASLARNAILSQMRYEEGRRCTLAIFLHQFPTWIELRTIPGLGNKSQRMVIDALLRAGLPFKDKPK